MSKNSPLIVLITAVVLCAVVNLVILTGLLLEKTIEDDNSFGYNRRGTYSDCRYTWSIPDGFAEAGYPVSGRTHRRLNARTDI